MEVMRRSIYSKILPSLPYIIFNYSNFTNSLNTDHLFILYYPISSFFIIPSLTIFIIPSLTIFIIPSLTILYNSNYAGVIGFQSLALSLRAFAPRPQKEKREQAEPFRDEHGELLEEPEVQFGEDRSEGRAGSGHIRLLFRRHRGPAALLQLRPHPPAHLQSLHGAGVARRDTRNRRTAPPTQDTEGQSHFCESRQGKATFSLGFDFLASCMYIVTWPKIVFTLRGFNGWG
jgi:hypothetical protein